MEPKADLDSPLEEAMKNLTTNSIPKSSCANLPAPKDTSSSDAVSCISTGDVGRSFKGSELNQEPLVGDQGMYSFGYYYPGFNAAYGGWDDNSYIQPVVAQADNGSYFYYLPGIENGYVSYNSFAPGAVVGVDGQLIGQQPYYQPLLHSPGTFPQAVYGSELIPAYAWDPSFVFLDGFQGSAYNNIGAASSLSRPNLSSKRRTFPSPKAYRNCLPSEVKVSSSAHDTSPNSGFQSKAAGVALVNSHLRESKSSILPNSAKSGANVNKSVHLQENGKIWNTTDKLEARVNPSGLDVSSQNQKNHRLGANNSKSGSSSGLDTVGYLGAQRTDSAIGSPTTLCRDSYNLPDFSTKHEHALFFVIKSYSEDDIHKSIKYNVWASTSNGNRKLDNAYKLAQEKVAEKGDACPVFLFFSVNASGQFCGVAEMAGPVDFTKNMEFWQQDKWNGFFPVKWHIIKDVPNPQFRHIILENNENKPVTNSRDTQEVKFAQGIKMLNIFKNYASKTSLLDDFDFYENRQKVMQERRTKTSMGYETNTDKIRDVAMNVESETTDSLKLVESNSKNDHPSQMVKC